MSTEDRIEARLQVLAQGGGRPDWSEVEERAGHGSRRWFRPLPLFAALAALVAGGAVAVALTSGKHEEASVSTKPAAIPRALRIPVIAGRHLYRPGSSPIKLSEPLSAPLLGASAPLAVRSPTGDEIAYHAWRHSTPSLRLIDPRTGADSVVAKGAQAAAWGAGFAYFKALHPRFQPSSGTPYLGNVVVASSPGQPARAWSTRPGPYRPIAWAGETLLVEVDPCALEECRGVPRPGVLAFSGPGEFRRLPIDTITAVSPDGRLIIGGKFANRVEPFPTGAVSVVAVADGKTVATLDLAQNAAHAPLSSGLGEGAWRRDTIVARANEGSGDALVAIHFGGGTRLRLDRVLTLDARARADSPHGSYFNGVAFDGPGTDRVATALRQGRSRILICQLSQARCVRGRKVPNETALAFVGNGSAPLR